MTRTWFADLRPLRLPFWTTFLALLVVPFLRSIEDTGDLASHFYNGLKFILAGVTIIGMLLLVTLPFGIDFQHRTFALMLSQPRSRWLIWRRRVIFASGCVAICTAMALLSHVAVQVHAAALDPLATQTLDSGLNKDALMIIGFLVSAACSACFFTLLARSVLGGMVFIVAGQVLATAVVYATAANFTGSEVLLLRVMIFAGAGYCALLLYLGWRAFSRLEVREVAVADPSSRFAHLPVLPLSFKGLRCTSTSPMTNLVRKELRLQKPVFILTAVCVISWAVLWAILLLRPARRETYEAIYAILTFAYIPVVSLLAGSISLGEEKLMGIAGWHLTFPISLRRQWLVKLGVALTMTLVLVPLGCFMGTWAIPTGGPRTWDDYLGIVLGCEVVTIVAFWTSTFVEGAVRATVATMLAAVALWAAAALGIWTADQFHGLQQGIVIFLLTILKLDPIEVSMKTITGPLPYLFCAVVILLLIAARSYAQFRRLQPRRTNVIAWSALILLVLSLGCFWSNDLLRSLYQIRNNSYTASGGKFVE